MRVLITGGTGDIGRAATKALLARGDQVRILDLDAQTDIEGVEYAQCDILDYDDLLANMRGCDVVVHLAAIRAPYLAPASDVYQVNTVGTFNIFEAAATLGIQRVVQASSINALGAYYGVTDLQIDYLPVDEDHRTYTTDPYSFSKQQVEAIGAYYWRRKQISSVALRFPGVYPPEYPKSNAYRQHLSQAHHLLDELRQIPEEERRAKLANLRAQANQIRAQFVHDYDPIDEDEDDTITDPLLSLYLGTHFNLWVALDERDAAQAILKSITAKYDGAHTLFINDTHNSIGYDTQALIMLFFPEVMGLHAELTGTTALISTEKARQLIGFEPEHSPNAQMPAVNND